MKKLTNWLNEVTQWDYDDAGRVMKWTLGNGTWEDITYDIRSRPISITLKKPGPVTLRAQSYTYDNASNVLSHTLAGVTTTYEYDNINQLTREYKGTSFSPSWQIGYSYDANGNRTNRNILGGAQEVYSVDDGDKLTSVTWSGGSKSFTYDGAGRRKTQTVGGATTTYNWDAESRLVSTTGAVATSNVYNGLDARASKTDSGGTRGYKRDGATVTDPVLSDNQAAYTPGISESRSGTSRYLHSGIKNADSRTLADKSVEATREYDAFGNVVSTGSSGTWQGPFGNAGGFGYQEDADTNLRLLGHRLYDPSVGAFTAHDPDDSDRNSYSYCQSNPLSFVDFDGLNKKAIIVIGSGIKKHGEPPLDPDDLRLARCYQDRLDRQGYSTSILFAPKQGNLDQAIGDCDGAVIIAHMNPRGPMCRIRGTGGDKDGDGWDAVLSPKAIKGSRKRGSISISCAGRMSPRQVC